MIPRYSSFNALAAAQGETPHASGMSIFNAKASKVYTVSWDRRGKTSTKTGTIDELIEYFKYTLEVGQSWEHEKGNKKVNMNPKNGDQLVTALNTAKQNAAMDGNPDTYYDLVDNPVETIDAS